MSSGKLVLKEDVTDRNPVIRKEYKIYEKVHRTFLTLFHLSCLYESANVQQGTKPICKSSAV